jgi:hypothetical protein
MSDLNWPEPRFIFHMFDFLPLFPGRTQGDQNKVSEMDIGKHQTLSKVSGSNLAAFW